MFSTANRDTNRPYRLFQVSLRTLFVLTAVFAIMFCWLAMKFREGQLQSTAVALIQRKGGQAVYEYQVATGPYDAKAVPATPSLLRKAFGDDMFSNVVIVRLERVSITDAEFATLLNLPRLETLSLEGATVTNSMAAYFEKMPQLQFLSLGFTHVTDDGMAHLRNLKQLKALSIRDTQVGDLGVEHLKGLSQLRELELFQTNVTDRSKEVFLDMPNLEELVVSKTQMTVSACEQIKKGRPSLKIK